MKKYLLAAGVLLMVGGLAAATSKDDIVYPVAALGGCETEISCRDFCDQAENRPTCLAFAKEHDLLSREQIEKFEKFQALGEGPGGCNSEESCHAYCEDLSHMKECVAFAEQAGFIGAEELVEAKKVLRVLEEGGTTPGACASRPVCETYCQDPTHTRECFEFAKRAGFISPEEIAEAEKFLPLMERGEMPGGCRSKDQCEEYCENEEHFEECLNFAARAGLVSPEEVEMAQKTGGHGPGGCRGREACEAFCQDPANQEICYQFAAEHGFIQAGEAPAPDGFPGPGADQVFGDAPPEVRDCVKNALGGESFRGRPSPDTEEKIRACFKQFSPPPPGSFEHFEGQVNPEPFPQEFQQQFQQQYQEQGQEQYQPELERQYPQEFQDQFRQQYEQQYQQQYEQQYQQYQSGDYRPPTSWGPNPLGRFLGNIWVAVQLLFNPGY